MTDTPVLPDPAPAAPAAGESPAAAAISPAPESAPVPATPAGTPEAFGFTPLTPEEARILGCLIEKQITTPEYYPLSLHALQAACNQKNNRDPVVAYDEKTVEQAVDRLRGKKFAWLMGTAGSRVPKYEHRLAERLHLNGTAEAAILCELLLRGPQTPGELRSRTARMHPSASLEELQGVIDALAGRGVPLVLRLPRLPGHKECRFLHLLGDAPDLQILSLGQPVTRDAMFGSAAESGRPPPSADRLTALEAETTALKTRFDTLQTAFDEFRKRFE